RAVTILRRVLPDDPHARAAGTHREGRTLVAANRPAQDRRDHQGQPAVSASARSAGRQPRAVLSSESIMSTVDQARTFTLPYPRHLVRCASAGERRGGGAEVAEGCDHGA